MTKAQALDLIQLLSALESFALTQTGKMLPDYLHERISDSMDVLREEVLK